MMVWVILNTDIIKQEDSKQGRWSIYLLKKKVRRLSGKVVHMVTMLKSFSLHD